MGFRFRRSFKIIPGIRLNLSKSEVNASIGRPGATINISERGTKATVGIPGTGLSYSEKLSAGKSNAGLQADDRFRTNDAEQIRMSEREDSKHLLIGIAFIAALIAIAYVISKL